jgi:glyoxylase-like metal-dependent hydrolase (beta-lactamase superfamily II)
MTRVTLEPHGDVTRVRLSHWRSRAVGYEVSAYLTRGVMIDSGFPAAAGEVVPLARERGVSAVIITHHHEDHSGGAAALAAAGIPLAMPAAVARLVEAHEPVPLYRRVTWGTPAPLGGYTPAGAIPGLELIPSPGHSNDHHVVWDAERRTLFGGDLFLGVKVRVAHPEENPRLLVRTLRRFAALEPVRLFDAHRGAIANPATALRLKADWIEEMIAAVDDRIARGWGDGEIRRELLGRESFSSFVSRGEYGKRNFVAAIRGVRTAHH